MGVLECYFGQTDRDGILRDFIIRGAYDLYIEGDTGATQLVGWSEVQPGTRIVTSAIFNQPRFVEEYKCPQPQCKAWNDRKGESDGWIDW